MNERFREAAVEFRAGRDRQITPVAAEPVRFEFFPACDFADKPIPPRHWHVDGLVPGGTVTLLSGDGGTGKSLLAMQLAVATAMGGRWLGQDVAGGGALYLSAEDDRDELHRRLGDICVSAGARLADLDRLTLCPLAGEDGLLASLDRATGALRPTALFRDLDARLASERPALVVLDTLADMFPGNENDRTQARQFVGMLRGLAIRHECALLLLAHPSLAGLNTGTGTSGSTGWNNSVRSRLYLSRITQDGYEADPDPPGQFHQAPALRYQDAYSWNAAPIGQSSGPDTGKLGPRPVATDNAKPELYAFVTHIHVLEWLTQLVDVRDP
jgi:hypothetical protein